MAQRYSTGVKNTSLSREHISPFVSYISREWFRNQTPLFDIIFFFCMWSSLKLYALKKLNFSRNSLKNFLLTIVQFFLVPLI